MIKTNVEKINRACINVPKPVAEVLSRGAMVLNQYGSVEVTGLTMLGEMIIRGVAAPIRKFNEAIDKEVRETIGRLPRDVDSSGQV